MPHITYREASGHGQLLSHEWSLFKSSSNNWHDLLNQLTVQIQIHFTNRCTFCFLNQLIMFCNRPLILPTIIGPTLPIGISPIFKCQENKCKNPINLSAPLVELPIFNQCCCGILISQVPVQAQWYACWYSVQWCPVRGSRSYCSLSLGFLNQPLLP